MKKELTNLDFLRACAVLFVVFDHTVKYTFGVEHLGFVSMHYLGRLGVLFFFVHTSCVLMMSLERQNGEGLFGRFYVRRAFRIYPLSIIAVAAALVGPRAPSLSPDVWVANFALVQNFTGNENAFGALWSLPIEVQMYLLLPFCFLLATRFRSIVPLFSLWAVATGLALEPHINWHLGPLLYAPCFVPGVIAYVLFKRRVSRVPAILWPVAIAFITLAFLYRPSLGWQACVTCLALGTLAPFFHQLRHSIVTSAAAQIAKYSYGIYLSHNLLLIWMRPTARTLPLFLLVLAAVSILSFHTVEQPLIRLGQQFTKKQAVALKAEPVLP